MNKGAIFISFFYPGHFGLPYPSAYFLEVGGNLAVVSIERMLKTAEVLDFSNTMICTADDPVRFRLEHSIPQPGDESISLAATTLVFASEDEVRPPKQEWIPHGATISNFSQVPIIYKTRRFSEIVVGYEIADPGDISDEDYALHKIIFPEFLRSYRYITRDYRPRYLNEIRDHFLFKRSIIKYSSKEEELSPRERLGTSRQLPLSSFEYSFPYGHEDFFAFEPKDSHSRISTFLAEGKQVHTVYEFLGRAIEAVNQTKLYKFAVLEAFIAIEVLISEILARDKLSQGVSKTKLKHYRDEVSISYKLNVELPMLLANLTKVERQLFGDIDWLRKLRNDVVHEGFVPDEASARKAIESVARMIDLLERKGIQFD